MIPGFAPWYQAEPKFATLTISICVLCTIMFVVWIGLKIKGTGIAGFLGVGRITPIAFFKEAGITLGAWVAMTAIYLGAYFLFNAITPVVPTTAMTETFTAGSKPALVFSLVELVFVAVGEEIAFRGYLQKQLQGLVRFVPLAIILQGVLFGFMHGYQGPVFMFLNFLAGVMYGIVAWNRKSLVPCPHPLYGHPLRQRRLHATGELGGLRGQSHLS